MPRFTRQLLSTGSGRLAAVVLAACLGVFLLDPAAAYQENVGPEGFARATPDSVGLSAERLEHAATTVRAWVEQGRIVGAVMLVIRHDRIALFETAGWADREQEKRLEPDAICSMRSMTKPLVGTAVLMLMEEKRLALQDRVSKYLPAFDTPAAREITVHQLLTHTSGVTGAIYEPLGGTTYRTLREAVDAVGAKGPTHPPGTRYEYSDPGTSTLGALISIAAGMPVEEFLQKRILDPLGMHDSFCELKPEDSRAARVTSAYRRDGDHWVKYWDPTMPAVVPFFRASGGLYASALDYARFMAMMLGGGEFRGRRLLSPESVRLATSPHSDYVYTPEDAAKRRSFYGLHWIVYTDKYSPVEPPLSAGLFGHSGSDGTLAWTDPASGLIGVYLTQSRGNGTGREFMRLVQAAIER